MTEEYEDELVTSHSDENPELSASEGRQPLAAYTTEGNPIDDLYRINKERQKKGWLGVRPEEAEHVIEYEDNEGNYWSKE